MFANNGCVETNNSGVNRTFLDADNRKYKNSHLEYQRGEGGGGGGGRERKPKKTDLHE